MKDWQRVLVGADTKIRDTMRVIDQGGARIAIVADQAGRLLGTLSDGDLRRALLGGAQMDDPVGGIMEDEPTSVPDATPRDDMLSLMRRTGLQQIPLVDGERRVTGLATLEDYFRPAPRPNWVVLMVGGLGSRLKELTQSTPKPMLALGGRPMLETIVRSFIDQGFRHVYLAVNYKAEMIEEHFGDGSAFGAEIRYLREEQRMGTAGALGLLPERPTEPILVANGDVLAKFDHAEMLDLHAARGAAATMAVREYQYQVPFGVVSEEDGVIRALDEKPTQRFMVNAGMYALSPHALALIPGDRRMDMPEVFNALRDAGEKTCCHPVRGYWLDVGRVADYEQAQIEYDETFR